MPKFKYFLSPMGQPVKKLLSKPSTERPWWRAPFKYLLRVRPRQRQLHGSMLHRLLGSRLFENALWVPDQHTLAKGVAIGTFIGMLPLIGLQIIVSAVLCYFMRANIAAAALATLISNPFTAPGLVWMQLELGHWVAPAFATMDNTHYEGTARFLVSYGKPLLVGSLVSAAVSALVAYPMTLGGWFLGERMIRRRKAARLIALRHHQHLTHTHPHHHPQGHPSSPTAPPTPPPA
jgi:uncharacterized protein (DUF2062 family)